jgi:hypothetical protein
MRPITSACATWMSSGVTSGSRAIATPYDKTARNFHLGSGRTLIEQPWKIMSIARTRMGCHWSDNLKIGINHFGGKHTAHLPSEVGWFPWSK